jgi:hypothetical protein
MRFLAIPVLAVASLGLGGATSILATCGPFTDTANDGFCPAVLEIFTLGITTGTTPTTFNPSGNVTRLQMAAFLSRSVDGVLARSSRRTLAGSFWTPQGPANLGLTTIGTDPRIVVSDGSDLWVSHYLPGTVSRVRASDGKLLEVWTGATNGYALLSAMGRIFIAGDTSPGNLYRIDPSQPAGAVTLVASGLGPYPNGMAYDGSRIWTGIAGGAGGVSIVTPGASIPWTVTTVTTGSGGDIGGVEGMLYDGGNIWTTSADFLLQKLDSAGTVVQAVGVGNYPQYPVFDGTNIWVPNSDLAFPSVSVVRASTGVTLATLTGNGLENGSPYTAAFDGQRILVTTNGGNRLSLWKAADLTPLGSVSTGASTAPYGACSDGINFWITLGLGQRLARF